MGRRILPSLLLPAAVLLHPARTADGADPPDPRAARARSVLVKHCYSCHGDDPKKAKGDGLAVLDRDLLIDRGLLVASNPDESELLRRVESDNADERMPPDPSPALNAAERRILRDWINGGAAAFEKGAPAAELAAASAGLAADVKEIFRTRCLECHGGTRTNAGVRILDVDLLVQKKRIVPGRPDESPLVRLVTAADDSVMPPRGQPRLSEREVASIRRWVAGGAERFPADVPVPDEAPEDPALKGILGAEYVLQRILAHVRALPEPDRPHVRYFSVNHLLTGGTTRDALSLHRDALAKALNHLSNEPGLATLETIDEPAGTVFAVDLRKLGWDRRPFERIVVGRPAGRSPINLFDLVLLEYPYATFYEDSDVWDQVLNEHVLPANLVRPIAYVRGDWFASVATQPPLYEDLLQLPLELDELEQRLGVTSEANVKTGVARRAGMTVSGVSRNNRVVERHPSTHGSYWKSFDFATSRGRENIFLDPLGFEAAGGEMIFTLPNGLQGYFLANGKGRRVNDAPTSIVTDRFAEDKTVRNGLACMRCHDQGMKDFADDVRKAVEKLPGSPGFSKRDVLSLYGPQKEMDELLRQDADRFLAAMADALGRPQTAEPLIPVSQRFLEVPLQLSTAAAELGLAETKGLEGVFRSPQFVGLGLIPLASGGVVRRDMWEDYFDDVVKHLGLGIPLVPIDGITRPDFSPGPGGVDVQVSTNRKGNTFAPGDELSIVVSNRSSRAVFIEVIGGAADGSRVILVPSTTVVEAGGEHRFPEKGTLKVQPGLGREEITVYASDSPLPSGQVLRARNIADRVVHSFYGMERQSGRFALSNVPVSTVRRTIVIETK